MRSESALTQFLPHASRHQFRPLLLPSMASLFEHKLRPSLYLGWRRARGKNSARHHLTAISRLIGLYLDDSLRPAFAHRKQRVSGGGSTQQSSLHGTQQYEDGLLGVAHEEAEGVEELSRHGPDARRLGRRRGLFQNSRQRTFFVARGEPAATTVVTCQRE